jgi:hypothetical protein
LSRIALVSVWRRFAGKWHLGNLRPGDGACSKMDYSKPGDFGVGKSMELLVVIALE